MGIAGDGNWKGCSKEYQEGHTRIFGAKKVAKNEGGMEKLLKEVNKEGDNGKDS
ncbi:MAG: hypothetical protein GQ474_07905 [Sulfurimonas sp.]|nr:hypothetical protein [Sulfurimonas sp.]